MHLRRRFARRHGDGRRSRPALPHRLRHRWKYRVHEQILPSLRQTGADVRWSDVAIQHVGYVDAALRKRKLARDLRLLELEKQEQPSDPFTLFNLGSVYNELGDMPSAIAALEGSLAGSHPKDSIGYYTLLLAALVGPTGWVFAFEPDPDNFALLRRNVELNGYTNVELFNAAVGARASRSRLYRSVDNAGDHRLHESPESRQSVEVDVVALDDVLRDRGSVEFVKIDVQGSEGGVLEGMASVTASSPRVKMTVEFWPAGLARAGYGAGRFLDGVRQAGFRVYEVDEAAHAVRKVDPERLLAAYPVASEGFTNLLCVKTTPW